MKRFLVSKGVQGEQIILRTQNATYIVSDSFGASAISSSRMHTGIRYADLMYDNIHAGIAYSKWISDFHSIESIITKILPF